jgi:hypothetical protein
MTRKGEGIRTENKLKPIWKEEMIESVTSGKYVEQVDHPVASNTRYQNQCLE